jgi:UDP-3-O-acyl-N-acetylglucosamine deacetylase
MRETGRPVSYVKVREPVCYHDPGGGFLVFEPPHGNGRSLTLDCGVSFHSAIGQQRIRLPVTSEWVRHGAVARTNTPSSKVLYCKTVGKLFADVRHLGYNRENVLIAGKRQYKNAPRLLHGGKSLEAVWHRAILDLLAAVALVDKGQLVGHITSFKAGHRVDVEAVKQLYLQDLLVPA